MKRILVPVARHDLIASVLEVSYRFAHRFGSVLEGVALQTIHPEVIAFGAMAGFPVTHAGRQDAPPPEELRALFTRYMADRDVPPATAGESRLGWLWQDGEPLDDVALASHGRVYDITVFGRPTASGLAPRLSTLEAALFESGRPVLIAPPAPPATIGQRVLIAWNGSTETARTTALAMPVLTKADSVVVHTVDGGMVPGPSGSQLADTLRLNGVKAEAVSVSPGTATVGECILAEARQRNCDLVIKGAYTQSRFRQMIFGGATSHILSATELPVFMAH